MGKCWRSVDRSANQFLPALDFIYRYFMVFQFWVCLKGPGFNRFEYFFFAVQLSLRRVKSFPDPQEYLGNLISGTLRSLYPCFQSKAPAVRVPLTDNNCHHMYYNIKEVQVMHLVLAFLQ